MTLEGDSPARKRTRSVVRKTIDVFLQSVKGLHPGTTLETAPTALCVAMCEAKFWLGVAHWLSNVLVRANGSLLASSTLCNYFGTAMSIVDTFINSDAQKDKTTDAHKRWLKVARESGKLGFLSLTTKKMMKTVNLRRRRAGIRVSQ